MDRFISADEAAQLLGLKKQSLAQLRHNGMGLKFYKPTPRKVVYKYSEVIAWIENSGQYETEKVKGN
jgi:predicted DNA-binding transcriptional regulator AlpA